MNLHTSYKRRRAIVHIGMHKTGTTAIQQFIKQIGETVRRAGLYWPGDFPAGAQHVEAHHYISWHLLGWHEFLTQAGYDSPFINSTKQRLQACPEDAVLLLSTENFDRLDSSQIGELASLLEGFEVSVILYVRRQDEFIQALHQTQVVHFNKKAPIFDDLNDPRLDYLALANRWAGVFGKDNILVRVYEKGQLLQENSVADFLAVLRQLGHAIAVPAPQSRVNVGLPSAYVELIRRLTANSAASEGIWKHAKQAGRKLYPSGSDQYWFLSPSRRRALLDKHRDSNAQLAREFLGRPDGRLFNNLDVPWNDEAWQQVYGNDDGLLSGFLDDVNRRLATAAPKPAPPLGASPSRLRLY